MNDFSEPECLKFVKELFSIVFEVQRFDEIHQAYGVFAEDFRSERVPVKMETIPRNIIRLKGTDSSKADGYFNERYQIGIDLPVLFQNSKENDTVFIVAEDPLRRENHADIILGVPFGLHIKNNREGRLKVYWKVVETLSQLGKMVYVTDIYKIWIKSDYNSKLRFNNIIIENFRNALLFEIETFKPSVVIALGNQAKRALETMELPNSVQILSFPHPSGSANKEWRKLFNSFDNFQSKLCNNSNKIAYLVAEINKYFKQQ